MDTKTCRNCGKEFDYEPGDIVRDITGICWNVTFKLGRRRCNPRVYYCSVDCAKSEPLMAYNISRYIKDATFCNVKVIFTQLVYITTNPEAAPFTFYDLCPNLV